MNNKGGCHIYAHFKAIRSNPSSITGLAIPSIREPTALELENCGDHKIIIWFNSFEHATPARFVVEGVTELEDGNKAEEHFSRHLDLETAYSVIDRISTYTPWYDKYGTVL